MVGLFFFFTGEINMLVAVVNLDIKLSVPRPVAVDKNLWDKYLDIIDSHNLEFSKDGNTGSLITLSNAHQKIQGMAKGSISSSMGRAYTIANDFAYTLRQEKLPFILELVMANDQNNGLQIDVHGSKSINSSYFPIYRSIGFYSHKSPDSASLQYDFIKLDTYRLLGSKTSSGTLDYFRDIQENLFYYTGKELDQKQYMDIFNAQKLLST